MTDPKRMSLAKAESTAKRIVDQLLPFSVRIEIAGSIRRRVGQVGDIDLVIEAKDQSAILARVKQSGTVITGDSPTAQNTIVRLGDYQLDLFFARPADRDLFAPMPCNWGSLLLCRTGSKEHNIGFAAQAKRRGLAWDPYKGLIDAGKVIACETEEAMYSALGWRYLQPTEREGNPFP